MRLLKFSPVLIFLACGGQPQSNDAPATLQPRLPTGNYLDPAGTSIELGSFPLNAVLSPEGDRLVVLLNGWREQGLQIVERSTGRIVQTVLQKAAFIGLAFAPDGKTLYVSGGNQDVVYRYDWRDKTATLRDSIIIGRKDSRGNGTSYPAGLAASGDGAFLYVAENLADSLAIVNVANGQVKHVPAGRYPYGVVEDADGNVIVSAWGQNVLTVIDAQQGKVLARIDGGRHPSAMVTTRDKSKLFVVSGSTDRVTIVDTRQRKVIGALQSSNGPGGEGATPNGLALSADERTLYVAEADNNAVAVWDLAPARLKGRIPVEWYPTGVVVAGDSVLVINGKGKGTAPNPALPHPGTGTQNRDETTRRAYVLGQLNGSLTTLTSNEFGDLAIQQLTPRVAAANGWNRPRTAAAYPPFEHVIYIIKENRTYDQIFGDLPQGDGDTSLVFFPRHISPNHHALAERFGLFDRFFVNAEVSAQGHNWSTAAYTTDYLEKTVQSNYSERGRSYDYEGENRGRVPSDEGEDDVSEPANGYLWDLAERAKVTLRNYGEYVAAVKEGDSWKYRATKPYLEPNTNTEFPGYDLSITDQRRADVYLAEFKQYVAAGRLPQLQIIRLPNDHTSGARANAPTPRAHMADNDLALGRIVEAVSKSPFWKTTVIFVLEDDAQNGPDHVDSHRSPLLVISPYSKGGVIHRFANTTDVIATIAEILKMGSLSQFDYYGRPLRDAFGKKPDLRPYSVLMPAVDLNEKNPAQGRGAIESRRLRLAHEDESDDDYFNEILWRAIKGEKTPYPGARRMPALLGR